MHAFVGHPFPPVYDGCSQILILGTMPSPCSRKNGFYYGHPQNRFWRVLAQVLSMPVPETNIDKTEFLLRNHIALWDVLQSCEIEGAQDTTIRYPSVNDITQILADAPIRAIFTTGKQATKLYERYSLPKTHIPAVSLPSTSPANAGFCEQELVLAYRVILQYLR